MALRQQDEEVIGFEWQKYLHVVALAVVGLVLLFIDFFTKAACYHLLPSRLINQGAFVLFENFLGIQGSLYLTLNKGAAWGVLASMQIPLLIFRMTIISGMLYYLFSRTHTRLVTWSLMIICVGAIGNVIDFFIYRSVVDFIALNFWGYSFPIFNIADTLITLGSVGLILSYLQKHERCQVD